MEDLFRADDFIQAAQLKKYKVSRLAKVLMKSLKLQRVNEVYQKSASDNSLEFIENALRLLSVQFKVRPEDLNNIPKSGAFITISNHPYGGIDGLLLLRTISEQRDDFRVMANFLLQKIEPLRDRFLTVNPFDSSQSELKSLKGIKGAIHHLKEGHSIGIFPAGEVSTIVRRNISDKEWSKSAIKLIQHSNVPVIPVYFSGSNSTLFHLLGLINPLLRTAKLPSELLNKKNKVIEIRIGHAIQPQEMVQFETIDRLGRYLRARTYALGSAIEVKTFFGNGLSRQPKAEAIAVPQPREEVVNEIKALSVEHILFESGEYCVYSAPSAMLKATLREVGRLREITYRAIGEGTNRARDLDEFDLYYHHLVIWNKRNEEIVGGYRIGKGAEIMRAYGIKGFYIHELFKIKRKLFPILKESLELGRSFIVAEYQRRPLPLFLLWKGILVFILRHPEYRYLIGPVSISSRFSGFSKSILIEFLKRNYYDPRLAEAIKPRNKFKPQTKSIDTDILLDSSQKDLARLDKFIQEIEPEKLNIPVLFKKYLQQNAKVIGFNLDPKFNDALDGLMVLDIYDVPITTLNGLLKEMSDPQLNEAMKRRNLA